jgi:hypothetical protein
MSLSLRLFIAETNQLVHVNARLETLMSIITVKRSVQRAAASENLRSSASCKQDFIVSSDLNKKQIKIDICVGYASVFLTKVQVSLFSIAFRTALELI